MPLGRTFSPESPKSLNRCDCGQLTLFQQNIENTFRHMHSKFRTAYPCDKYYPCRQPTRFLDSGLLNPLPSKTICANKMCTNTVDMNEIRVCVTTASDVDVSCGVTRVCGTVTSEPEHSHRKVPCGTSLATSSATVVGDVFSRDLVLLAGSCIKNSENSNAPFLMSQEGTLTAPDFWDLGPQHFCRGETVVVLCGPNNTPQAIGVTSGNDVASVNIKRFHDVTLQKLDFVDSTKSWYTCVRASRDCDEWTPWHSLQVNHSKQTPRLP